MLYICTCMYILIVSLVYMCVYTYCTCICRLIYSECVCIVCAMCRDASCYDVRREII